MDFDTLQQRWATLDQTLDARLQQHGQLLRQLYLQQARAALAHRSWGIGLDIIIDVVALLLLGSFIAAHLAEPRFLVPALVLHLFTIAQVGASIRQVLALRSLDYGAPLVELQRRLVELRVQRLRFITWTLACIPLLWPPLLIVGAKGLIGLDVYAVMGAPWLLLNLLFGLACVPLVIGLARWAGPRAVRLPWLQRLLDDLAGQSLRRARAALDAIGAFEGADEGRAR